MDPVAVARLERSRDLLPAAAVMIAGATGAAVVGSITALVDESRPSW